MCICLLLCFVVQSYFLQMSLELLAGAKMMTMLVDGKLNTTEYLPSYSIDYFNPYRLKDKSLYSDSSGYYVSVSIRAMI